MSLANQIMRKPMRLPRWLVVLLLGSSAIVVLTAAGWWWFWWPERTVQQFEHLWNQNGRQEAARLMAPSLFEVFGLREQIRHEQRKLGEKVDEKGLLIDPTLNLVIGPRTCRDVMSGRATAYPKEKKDWYITVQRGEVVDAGWIIDAKTAKSEPLI